MGDLGDDPRKSKHFWDGRRCAEELGVTLVYEGKLNTATAPIALCFHWLELPTGRECRFINSIADRPNCLSRRRTEVLVCIANGVAALAEAPRGR